ncbi:ABC transporter ATP-binding protein [Murdochiella vaginalis]|uniref:ABC transporter ATP-binding protein n=1 Tax=Murdochiella vaginalis TaxID=1852373 RepID=UPI0008FE2A8D|nr:ABC transporter ATP-binding protein [Murdochiella vaginalis]
MMELIKVQKNYGDHQIFKDLSFRFEAGNIYALIGKSGSGKTTLLNMMAKLEAWNGGQIIYRGKALESYKERTFFEKELGYLFQNLGLIENASVAENLDLGLVGKKMSKEEKKQAFRDVLVKVNLSYLPLDRKIYTLSGGEAQRISVGKLMLKKPSLLLADEPTASLDPKTADEILKLVFQMRDPERLIIIATHSPEIWQRCDEVLAIS